MALFKKGYEAARQEKKRQEEAREQMGKRLFRFFLSGDGAEAKVRFLTEEPINFNEHTVKVFKGGKERYDSFLCTGDSDCPYCEEGNKSSFKGAFLIWDYTEFEVKDSSGKKKKVKGSLKLYVAGTRVLSQLDRLSNRYGLTERDYYISRTGTGTDTSYMIERTDDVIPLTKAKITNMLPEKLREQFDGTMESLYSIVEEQLKMYLPDYDASSDGDDYEDEDSDTHSSDKSSRDVYKGRKNLVSCEDEEEDEDVYDYEDEEPPKKKSTILKGSKSSIKSVFKKTMK